MMKNGFGLLTVCSTAAVLCALSGLDAAPTPTDLGGRLFRMLSTLLEFKDVDDSYMVFRNVFRRTWTTAEPCLVKGFSQLDPELIKPVVTFFETDKNCLPALESKVVYSVKDVNVCIDGMRSRFDPAVTKVDDAMMRCIAFEKLWRDVKAAQEAGNEIPSH